MNDSPATPVGALSDSDSVNTLVDTRKTLTSVNVSKDGPGGWGLDARLGLLVSGDLSSLHASAETCRTDEKVKRWGSISFSEALKLDKAWYVPIVA